MLDGQVLGASQGEYKPFGKPPLHKKVLGQEAGSARKEFCQEGFLSGSGRRVFVRKRALPGRNFVRKGFCQEAGSARKEFCQEEAGSARKEFCQEGFLLGSGLCQEGILSGRVFVRKRALPGRGSQLWSWV